MSSTVVVTKPDTNFGIPAFPGHHDISLTREVLTGKSPIEKSPFEKCPIEKSPITKSPIEKSPTVGKY